jgi:hypothetical protein
MMRRLLIAFSGIVLAAALASTPALARGHGGGGHAHYGYQGGHYAGGVGSSHKGGHYVNPRTGNHYTRHQ